VNRSNAAQSTSSPSSRSKMSFTDTSKLALQIKDILPNASYELIQRHIQAAPTLDIDTVLASILDDEQLNAEEEDSASNSNNNLGDLLNSRAASFAASTSTSSNSSPLHHGGTKSTSALRSATNRFKSYEERKFELLNDARRRFLSKNPN
jgi:hypothetical protein